MQAWPLFMMAFGSRFGSVAARSASSRMIAADFPPSSSVHRLSRSPQRPPIRLPAAVEPVNEILSTPGWRHQVLADLAAGGNDRQDALGQARLGEDLGQAERVERRLRRRLEDDRAAGRQRRSELGRRR